MALMYSLFWFSPHVVGQFWDNSIMHVYTLNIHRHTQNKDVWRVSVLLYIELCLKRLIPRFY